MKSKPIVIYGGFDDIRSGHLRWLEEAAKLGEVTVLLWPDETLAAQSGAAPKFPLAERLYFLKNVRYVSQALAVSPPHELHALPRVEGFQPQVWVDTACTATEARRSFCQRQGLDYQVLSAAQLSGFPQPAPLPSAPGRKKVVATGCFDWFHSGHVRFAEELNGLGDLYIIVGHDANIRLLKGQGHPLLCQEERRYVVGSIKFVKEALISSGEGWLDAEPEIRRLKPDMYVVNEDGDKGGKREFCARLGLEYRVMKRSPAPGLQQRSSTALRGY